MQNDFVDGSLGTKEAVSIVERVKNKVETYLSEEADVIFTRDTHPAHYLDTQEGKHLPVAHCIKGTNGWEIIPALQELSQRALKVIDKPTFGSVELAQYIADHDYEQVELAGLCTDICVVSNALLIKAYVPECTIKVDASCCAGVTVESHCSALQTMKMCQIEVSE